LAATRRPPLAVQEIRRIARATGDDGLARTIVEPPDGRDAPAYRCARAGYAAVTLPSPYPSPPPQGLREPA
jgi:hypothetical protein